MAGCTPTIDDDYGPELRLIRRIGYVCFVVYAAILLGLAIAIPDPYLQSWQLVLGHLFCGRAFSISLGFRQGFHLVFMLFQASVQDTIILLLFYPLLVRGYRRVAHVRLIGPAVLGIRSAAERHRDWVRRYGAIGLALFVLFPFWSTGALAGGVLGYLIGLRTWINIVSVTIGNFVAVVAWLWFFDTMWTISEDLGYAMPWIVLPILAFSIGYIRLRNRRRKRAEARSVKDACLTGAGDSPSCPPNA